MNGSIARSSHRPREGAQLLVFTLGPHRERARRRLLPGHLAEWELAFHRRCVEQALQSGSDAGFEITVCAPRPLPVDREMRQLVQGTGSFGERLRRAIATLEQSGRPLAVIGTDCPELGRSHLERALEAVDDDPERVVVGPSTDGGFYLLASARPLAAALEGVRWCRRDTLESLLQALREAGRPVLLLPSLADVDRAPDLEAWIKRAMRHGGPPGELAAHLFESMSSRRRPLCIDLCTTFDRGGWEPVPARAPPAA